MDINTCTLVGRLTRDMEVRYAPSGSAIANFSIGVNRGYKKNNGEWVDEPSFFDCTIIGNQNFVESLRGSMVKGKQVGVSGYLKQEHWTDKQTGQTRYAIKLIVKDIQLLGGSGKGSSAGAEDYSDIQF